MVRTSGATEGVYGVADSDGPEKTTLGEWSDKRKRRKALQTRIKKTESNTALAAKRVSLRLQTDLPRGILDFEENLQR